MQVKIVKVENKQHIDALIMKANKVILPSLTDGWQFNFRSNTRKENLETYILVCKETPEIIEGCLSFKLRDRQEPYMAYVGIAPHNKGEMKHYDHVAGCMIAFACRLSMIHGEADYKGWLTFDVLEEHKADQTKLMSVYSKRYGALRYGITTMVIPPEGGQKLITDYLTK